MKILNKVSLITGGMSGIGLAISKELLRQGVKGVALLDINVSAKEQILKSIEAEFGKGKAKVIKTDVTKLEEIKSAFDETVQTFGNLDIVVNNAGIVNDDWEFELEVNFKGAYKVFLQALEHYLPKYKTGNEGVIINTASIAGLDAMPTGISYAAAKAALVMIGRCYAFPNIYEKYKVKNFTICPGLTYTPIAKQVKRDEIIQQLGRNMKGQKPEELATLAVAAIETFQNGDVYIIEAKKINKINFPIMSEGFKKFAQSQL